jgi:Cu-processing system ATP-binding protein
MPQIARYPENLTAREILAMISDLRGNPAGTDETLVDELRLEGELDKPFRTLSGGNRQKVSAVLAFASAPRSSSWTSPRPGSTPSRAAC